MRKAYTLFVLLAGIIDRSYVQASGNSVGYPTTITKDAISFFKLSTGIFAISRAHFSIYA